MESSPQGRQIEYVEGSPDEIIERGRAIKALGDDMLESATTLENIKNNALEYGGQQGKAIEKLRDSIGDSFETLREAGNLYEPVGPVIKDYGVALDDVQPLIKSAVDDCEDLWGTYVSLPGQIQQRVGPAYQFGPEPGSPEAEQQAEEDEAKRQALEAWENRAEDFDRHYDTWEDAFDTAVENIGDEMAGSIKDSFWDNFGDIINVLTEILSWASLIVGIIAIFAGGWLILAIAAVLAVAVLALTAIKYANGEASGWDLLFAGLAIIPVGKVTNLTKFAQFPKLARQGAGGARNALGRTWKALDTGPVAKFMASKGGKPFTTLNRSQVMENLVGKGYRASRSANISLYIGNRTLLEGNLGLVRGLSLVDTVASRGAAVAGHAGRVTTGFGTDFQVPGAVGVFI